MSDLIERLRDKARLRAAHGLTGWVLAEEALLAQAADEIERLTAALQHEADCVEAAKAEIERLTAENKMLRHTHRWNVSPQVDDSLLVCRHLHEKDEKCDLEHYVPAERLHDAIRERDDLRDVLLRNGFVQCDIPACNCGSWHHRYGLPERMQEIKDALAEAGHELSNANGNLTLNALKALISERDAMANVLPGHCYMDPPDGGDVPVLEQLRRMAKDAARYRWLRGREDGRYMTAYAFRTDIDEVCLGDELDAAVDAAMDLTRPAEES